jgi:lambda family phage portal protein
LDLAGERGRRGDGWRQHTFGSHAAEALATAPALRSAARRLVASKPWAAAGVNALVTGLVGAGITSTTAHEDTATREAIQAAFDRWTRRADADARTDLFGLQAAAVRALVTDGEIFLLATGSGWRLLPAGMVDEADTRELPGGGYRVAGVEFDAEGRRIAYMVRPERPTDPFATARPAIRVPAEDVLHLMLPLGAGQVRGVSWLAPVIPRLAALDTLEDALLVGAQVSALHAGFLIDQNGTASEPPYDGLQVGSTLESGLEPGALKVLPAGMDVKFSSPQQAQQTAEFVSHQIRAVAMGLGVPAHLVSGDLRDANYGSLRAGMIAYRQRLEQIQFGTLVPQMVAPMFERAVNLAALSGELGDIGLGASEAEHYPPPMPWIDPLKDVAAVCEAIAAGLMSRRQAVALGGYSVESLDAEIAADQERARRLGLKFGDRRDDNT